MAARNDITGDSIATKNPSEEYRNGWDRIFGKSHVTPADGNVFADLGFPKEEAEELLQQADNKIKNESRDSTATNRDQDQPENG